jgi:hypothetical protein
MKIRECPISTFNNSVDGFVGYMEKSVYGLCKSGFIMDQYG